MALNIYHEFMHSNLRRFNKRFIILVFFLASSQLFSQPEPKPSLSLSVAGINTMEEASNKLMNIASYIDDDKPYLIVHCVNWFRYDSDNPGRIIGWNGNDGKTDSIILSTMPLLGHYSCDDTLYIDWLLGFSKALGIDELNIDYEGGIDYPEEYALYYNERSWDSWFPVLLKRAEKYRINISVMYEPKSIACRLALRQGKNSPVYPTDPEYYQEALALLKADLKLICDRFTVGINSTGEYVVNPIYRRVAGLPVIWVFGMNAGALTAETWKQAIKYLHNDGYAFILASNSYPESQAVFDTLIQGLNPWLDQLFTGFQSEYPELWNAAQQASREKDHEKARQIANQFIDLLAAKELNIAVPVRRLKGPAHFNITPLAIGFQDAEVNAWGFRPPVYIEPNDRTYTEPGKVFRTYFSAAQKSPDNWYLICSGDDLAEQTHMLIPDTEHGFSGPYAIALMSAWLGKKPDILKAIQITEDYIHKKNECVSEEIIKIMQEAKQKLHGQLNHETISFNR